MDLSEIGPSTRRHPWEIARANFFVGLIKRSISPSTTTIADVGSGDGWLATQLLSQVSPEVRIHCIDTNYTLADLAASVDKSITRSIHLPSQQFDAMILLDVIEHIDDVEKFLRQQILPRTHDKTVIVFSVPAHQSLFSEHDVALGHFRRYSPSELQKTLSQHFTINKIGPLFVSLLHIRLLQKALRMSPGGEGVGNWQHGSVVTKFFSVALAFDGLFSLAISRLGIRGAGLSIWAVCTPKNGHKS
jgi:ubiquinone/menaquinone biosynthesis C-methylase UbiE